MIALAEYIKDIRKNVEKGDSTEHTHRPALERLLEACGKNIDATNEPRRIACGAPDFNLTRKGVPVGHVETKDIGVNLDEMERGKGPSGEQFKRYSTLPNWILTDYLEFRWYVAGQKRLTVRVAALDSKGRVKATPDGDEKLAQLLTAFYDEPALTVGTAKEIAQRMAGLTRIIRDLIIASFKQETEETERKLAKEAREPYGAALPSGGPWLHNWLAAFRETLIPDLGEHEFADMFAQTLAYGLFASRMHEPNRPFSRESAATNLPRTNPFLRELFEQVAGVRMPDTIAWAVDDMVELLKHADMAGILREFGKCRGREDPVVHFYETFLAAYDPAMREIRGVFYTPEPIVSYIVRSIDWLLKTRLGRPKGLGDENTLILDTAVGTATFLYFVIDLIYQGFRKQLGAWDGYVSRHLLPRIFGFELLMAPYAVAHLKLSMLLEQTGYTFGGDQRLGIYLTNTLEEAAKKSEMLLGQFISREANAAAAIKRERPIMVVLGNPPYSGHSANRSDSDVTVQKGDEYVGAYDIINNVLVPVKKKAAKSGTVRVPNFIGGLLREYYAVDGAWLDEKNPKWLQDDYVKFIRFAEWRINLTGEGVLGYITNHGYLDNPTFRGMRQHLMQTFDEIRVLDLHGNSKKKETTPDGGRDENVFDIQQGVAILLAIKRKRGTGEAVKEPARVWHGDLWGRREIHEGDQLTGGKYHWLGQNSAETTAWQKLEPSSPFYLFTPQDITRRSEYETGWKVTDIFPANSMGVTTGDDDRFVAMERTEFPASLPGGAPYLSYQYRPFDNRWLYHDPSLLARARAEFMRHLTTAQEEVRGTMMRECRNQALLTVRRPRNQLTGNFFISDRTTDKCAVSSLDNAQVFPLFLRPRPDELDTLAGRRPNLGPEFLKSLAERLRVSQEEPHGLPQSVAPEDIFHYAYAVFYSPAYRTRYAEFLRIDFPRLPLTSNRDLFFRLAALGEELVGLHLMDSPKLNEFITEFPEKGTDSVEKVQYTEKHKRVWINPKQYFSGVPKGVWDFHIGGYQVCDKWLKDRKGRKLTYEDTQHYQRVVVALNETMRLMLEIDDFIEAHGGWPGAFHRAGTSEESGERVVKVAEPRAEYGSRNAKGKKR